MSASKFLGRLHGVQGRGPRWRAICPAHETKRGTRSLAVFEADDGRLLVKCHAGCEVVAIVRALGMDLSDLFPPRVDDDKRPAPVRKPWRSADLIAALRAETMIGWVLLTDVGNGMLLSQRDRERAKLAAQRAVHLMVELERSS